MMRILLFAALLLASGSGGGNAETWALAPEGYAYKPATPCLEDPVRAEKPFRPGGAVYKVCEDQLALVGKAIEDARAEGKILIATVGATWCPWCAALQRAMPGPEFFERKGDALDYAASFRHIEIGISTVHNGKNALIYSGDAVVKALLTRADGVQLEAIPFIFMIDPTQPTRVFGRNTKDLSDLATGQQDMAKFRGAIAEGFAFLKSKKKAGLQ